MPTITRFHKIVLPKGLRNAGVRKPRILEQEVKKQIRAFELEQKAEMQRLQARAKAAIRELGQQKATGEKIAKVSGIDIRKLQADAKKKTAQYLKSITSLKDKEKALRLKPEHNPTRYPPYDYWWYSYSWWGVSPTHTFSPRTSDGRLKINASCMEPAGGVTGSCGVGMWYYAESSGTLAITAQTRLYGACEAMAWSIPFPMGYVYNKSKLRVGAWTQGSFNSDSRNYYKKSGVSVYDFYTGFDGQVHTLTHYIPVSAGKWYLLWAIHDTSQTADVIASTVTNVRMYVNSFIYYLI